MSRFVRQSFLGVNSEAVLDATTVGLVGLGGGGSHIVQQFAHIGIGRYVLADHDRIDFTNTTRLVGGTLKDIKNKMWKTEIAARLIRSLQPNAAIIQIRDKWQTATDQLKGCDLILGAVDSFVERDQLERFARRHLIPYIDIGMDVHDLRENGFLISGQVILSTPGNPCLWCCGLITDKQLKQEATQYGLAGGRPQVIWPNGILASTAVGLAIQVITPWFKNPPEFAYVEYDGNKGIVSTSARIKILKNQTCKHHPADEVGDPFFNISVHRQRLAEQRAKSHRWWKIILRRLLGSKPRPITLLQPTTTHRRKSSLKS
ncbi:MAG: ThiF family adenylyltransferase [Nitrospira sp.]|nr:ThiF family adenylyltransferase [Nitrospira sp.]